MGRHQFCTPFPPYPHTLPHLHTFTLPHTPTPSHTSTSCPVSGQSTSFPPAPLPCASRLYALLPPPSHPYTPSHLPRPPHAPPPTGARRRARELRSQRRVHPRQRNAARAVLLPGSSGGCGGPQRWQQRLLWRGLCICCAGERTSYSYSCREAGRVGGEGARPQHLPVLTLPALVSDCIGSNVVTNDMTVSVTLTLPSPPFTRRSVTQCWIWPGPCLVCMRGWRS